MNNTIGVVFGITVAVISCGMGIARYRDNQKYKRIEERYERIEKLFEDATESFKSLKASAAQSNRVIFRGDPFEGVFKAMKDLSKSEGAGLNEFRLKPIAIGILTRCVESEELRSVHERTDRPALLKEEIEKEGFATFRRILDLEKGLRSALECDKHSEFSPYILRVKQGQFSSNEEFGRRLLKALNIYEARGYMPGVVATAQRMYSFYNRFN